MKLLVTWRSRRHGVMGLGRIQPPPQLAEKRTRRITSSSLSLLQLLNLLLIPPVYQTHLKVRGQKNPSGSVHMDQLSKH